MKIEKYKIGQKITLTRKNVDKDESFYSTVQNIKDNEIYIDLPYKGEIPLVLMHNEQVTIKYVAQSAAFSFTTYCLGIHKESQMLRFYRLKAPADQGIKKIQLREFVRIPIMLDVEYYIQDSEEIHKGTMVDLSAGGMRLATKDKLRPNQVVDLLFKIKKKNQIIDVSLKAQVIRNELVDQQMNIYHSGLKFLNLPRSLEDTMVSFVFLKQMEQLRRR